MRTSVTIGSPASTDPDYLATLFQPLTVAVLSRPPLCALPVPVAAAPGGAALSCEGASVSALQAVLVSQGPAGGYDAALRCSPGGTADNAGAGAGTGVGGGGGVGRRRLAQLSGSASACPPQQAPAVVLDLSLSFGNGSSASPAEALGAAQAAMEAWAAEGAGGGVVLCPTQAGASAFALIGYVQVRCTEVKAPLL